VYEILPGWQSDTTGIRDKAQIPPRLGEYIRFIEEQTGVRVGMLSVGPDRDATLEL
jgi:adenylosuccinate synthase